MSSFRSAGTYAFGWHYIASGFIVLHTTGAFSIVSRLYYGEFRGGFTTTTVLAAALNIGFVLVCFWLFLSRSRRTRSISTGEFLAVSLAVLFLLSIAWSVDPSTTLRRGGLYFFFVLGVIGIATYLTDREFTGLVSTACLLSAVASVVLLIFSPNSALGLPDSLEFRTGSHVLVARNFHPEKCPWSGNGNRCTCKHA